MRLYHLMLLVGMGIMANSPSSQAQVAAEMRQMQEAQREARTALEAQMQRQGFRPTRADVLEQSLEELLNAGWGIVSADQVTAGSSFLLRDTAGRRWTHCFLSPRPTDDGAGASFASPCRNLN